MTILAASLLAASACEAGTGDKGMRPAESDPPASTTAAPTLGAGIQVALEEVALGFEAPVHVTHAGDGSGRLFVVEQAGRIRVIEGAQVLDEPFLDLSDLVSAGGERGMLSAAFHPDYERNGRLFVYYTDSNGDSVVAEFRVAAGDPNRADRGSLRTVLFVDQPAGNHNGGLLAFGPDGYLYVGLGDGGGSGGGENGQRLDTLLGKLLRMDVDAAEGEAAYGVPADNPFAGVDGARPEIWAYGLRNPWRFSFDRETGDLYVADVGSRNREEVSFQPASSSGGENYGWRVFEGTVCVGEAEDCDGLNTVAPIYEYEYDEGRCVVTGGHVYRGEREPQLRGTYIFGDYCSGQLFGLSAEEAAEGPPGRASWRIPSCGYRRSAKTSEASSTWWIFEVGFTG